MVAAIICAAFLFRHEISFAVGHINEEDMTNRFPHFFHIQSSFDPDRWSLTDFVALTSFFTPPTLDYPEL